MNELSVMKNPVALFTDGGVDEFIKKARESAKAEVFDVSTAKGRKSIASKANDVAKMKVAIDKAGKELVGGWKEKAKVVDADRKKIRDEFDALKIEVRKPLTDWEEEQKEIEAQRKEQIQLIKDMLCTDGEGSAFIGRGIEILSKREDEDEEIKDLVESVLERLLAKFIIAENAEKEAEELRIAEEKKAEEERIQREKEEEEKRIAREEEIARKAKEEAEAKAAKEAKEKEEAHKREQARQQQAIEDEKRRADEAEKQRIRDEAIAEENKKRALEQAEADKKRALVVAEENKKKAIEAERQRVEAEKAKQLREEQARAEDLAHRKSVNNEVLESIMSVGISEEQGKALMKKMIAGEVPNVKFKY